MAKTELFSRHSPGGVYSVYDESKTTGNIFWVDSGSATGGDGSGYGSNPDKPFLTLNYARSQCTANNGDRIYLMPGHAETVASAAAINLSVAGVETIGIGNGADKPTFTFSDTASTITMTAASNVVRNILIKPSVDSVVSPIVVSAADCTIDVEVQDASATVECVNAILTTAAADRLDIKLKYRGFIAGNACVNAIRLVGVDTARIYVDFYGKASTSVVEFHTTACHDIDIKGKFFNSGTSITKNIVDTATGSTWSAEGWDGNSNRDFSGGSDKPAMLFVPGLGYGVTKSCDLSGANDDLFTVTGKVLITLLAGEVTTTLSGAESFQLRIKTDNIALCAATTIDTDGDGTQYLLSGDFGDTMNGGSTPGLRAADVNSLGGRGSFVVGDAGGTATIESNTTGNNGVILFTLFYLPLESDASVAAAA